MRRTSKKWHVKSLGEPLKSAALSCKDASALIMQMMRVLNDIGGATLRVECSTSGKLEFLCEIEFDDGGGFEGDPSSDMVRTVLSAFGRLAEQGIDFYVNDSRLSPGSWYQASEFVYDMARAHIEILKALPHVSARRLSRALENLDRRGQF